jgi:uncharacterized surface protein with fasciclin (FAS1) repeats
MTAFVPSNRAFARVPKLVYLYFLRHPDRLRALLKYHLVKGTFKLEDLVDDGVLDTLLHNLTSRYDSYTHAKSNYTVSHQSINAVINHRLSGFYRLTSFKVLT